MSRGACTIDISTGLTPHGRKA
eukprot:gene9509-biopygen15182